VLVSSNLTGLTLFDFQFAFTSTMIGSYLYSLLMFDLQKSTYEDTSPFLINSKIYKVKISNYFCIFFH
jgi:hypothetical protein